MSTYEISKSSLLSLKAEILRKQEELIKAKAQNRIKKAQPKKPLEVKNKDVEKRIFNDRDDEEADLLKKSRSVLESKAKLYDKLSKRSNFTDEETERNKRFLVRFDKKNRNNDLPPEESADAMDVDKYPESDEEHHFSDEYEPSKDPSEEWVEYTDCLGRTRKCMRKDLEFLKSKDADLRASIDKTENKEEQLSKPETNLQERNSDNEDKPEEEFNENSELLSSDMRRELLRQQWEKEEEELRKKDDIHYQDILFNEARTHGVGYYGFSKDEEERAKQQEALKNLREETAQQQRKAQELKSLREKQLAARAKAARNRKRARMGLPPEEDEPEVIQQPEPEVEKPDEQNSKQKAEEEKIEKEKEVSRKRHIRPWDIGKEGVRKEHYEHTQEEWVDKKRKERPKEFAPPCTYSRSFRSELKHKAEDSEVDKTLFFSSKKNQHKDKQNLNKLKDEELFFIDTTIPPPNIKARNHVNPYKTKESFNYTQTSSTSFESTPIVNECEDFDDEQDRLLNDFKSTQQNKEQIINCSSESDSENDEHRGKGIEVAPPPTFDYYGPSSVKKSKPTHSKGNLEDSISAGLKFLRKQAEKKDTSTKHPSEMFLL